MTTTRLTEHERIERHLPGFRYTEDGYLIYREPGFRDSFRVWTVAPFDYRHLSPGERRALAKAQQENYAVFLVGKTGRAGWNVRKTFPRDYADKRIGFLVVLGGEVLRLNPTAASIVRPLRTSEGA